MTPEQFAYWLQGFAELTPDAPSAAQWQAIRDHLALVFEKKTPPLASDPARSPVRTSELRPGDVGAPNRLLPTVEEWIKRNTYPGLTPQIIC